MSENQIDKAYQISVIASLVYRRVYTALSYPSPGGYICILRSDGTEMRQEEISAFPAKNLEQHFINAMEKANGLYKRPGDHTSPPDTETIGGAIRLSDGCIIAFSSFTRKADIAFCAALAALTEWETDDRLIGILSEEDTAATFIAMQREARRHLQQIAC